jgi:hypothetical protein
MYRDELLERRLMLYEEKYGVLSVVHPGRAVRRLRAPISGVRTDSGER